MYQYTRSALSPWTSPETLSLPHVPAASGATAKSHTSLKQPPTQPATYFWGLASTFLSLLDTKTREHSLRVAQLARQLMQELSPQTQLPEQVYLGGLVHDVGKLFIPRAILLKMDALAPKEIQLVRQHPQRGSDLLARYGFPQEVVTMARYHHEYYNGAGYPFHLAGNRIPFAARVLAVADSFDAMTSARCYRKGVSVERALAEITGCAGKNFDPHVVRVLTTILSPQKRLGQEDPAPTCRSVPAKISAPLYQ